MIIAKRSQAIFWFLLVILGWIILAVSLPMLQLKAGMPIIGIESGAPQMVAGETGTPARSTAWLLQFGLVLAIIFILLALLTALLKKASIKQVVVLAALLLLFFIIFGILPTLSPSSSIFPYAPKDQNPVSKEMVNVILKPPTGLLTWVAAGLLLVGIALITRITAHLNRRPEEDPLAVEARVAVEAIAGGNDLRDVIVHCYLDMERVIAQERGIERGKAVTPREFETHLLDRGIPRVPVLQLTQLFEKARYGDLALDQQDEQAAVQCLHAIQSTCQHMQRGNR